ncbi:HAD family hydrolase [Mycobacterium vicinigordonae]|uniref:HAD family phosphatase n=1 Tax=Mycobacterium vicinigordonae TaxID=1719132 RepID=A0A7D6IAL8_9MYCO|nr:HAD family phosphatase [Mycobacterium vicinigordonae]QLL09856.1 HAD family phosphatase [Mycobacterium vicinigordonae]
MAQRNGPIEGVVFDMGGVLTVDPFQGCLDYAGELNLPAGTFVDQLRGPEFAKVETGELSMREYLKFACRDVETRLGVAVDIRRLADCLAAGQRVRPEMVALIGDLASDGVKVGVLTNNAKEARSWWSSGVLPIKSFAAVVDSSEVGVRKPNPAIFSLLVERIACQPARLLYFDDVQENVDGAAICGLTARLFTQPDACREECVRHGLLRRVP